MLHVERDILRGLTAEQFRRWEMYAELDPFDEVRADYRAASIVQMLYNLNRSKQSQPGKLQDFLLKFGDIDDKPKQTPKQQIAMLKLLAAMHANEAPVVQVTEDGPKIEPTPAEQAALDAARKAMH